jgi:hypothetical protein
MSSQAIVTSNSLDLKQSDSKESEFVNSLDKFININRKKLLKLLQK